jgi:hypothetical protein
MDVPSLAARRDELLRQLRAVGPVFRGSLGRVRLTCGKSNCRCRPVRAGGAGRRHVAFYASYRAGGRAQVFQVPADQVAQVRAARAAWGRMKALLEKLAEAQVSLWRAQHEQEKQRRKVEGFRAGAVRDRGARAGVGAEADGRAARRRRRAGGATPAP